jgi:hypothetical protein
MISVRNEGHGDDLRLEQFAPLLEFELRSNFSEGSRHIAHGDGSSERRRVAAAGDPAHFISLAIEHQRTFAHRLAAFHFEPDPQLWRTIIKLGKNTLGPWEAAFTAAAFVDGEGKTGHHRCRRAIDIMTVKRQSVLEPQRIAGNEPDRLY